ncbi:MAG: Rha family transcriptional regulator [Nitrospirae bacterium]|nr:Rha family transcriptional regulator [Nitrospirota bacterium]
MNFTNKPYPPMEVLVYEKDGEAHTTSREVAAWYGFTHMSVMYAVKRSMKLHKDHKSMYNKITYKDYDGVSHDMYEMTEAGFFLLDVNFSRHYRVNQMFIQAFSNMREAIYCKQKQDDEAIIDILWGKTYLKNNDIHPETWN